MLARTISKAVAISAVAIAGTGAAHAQSSVQCTLGPNGQLQAALVWRNTLGTERADALCRTASIPVAQQQIQQRPTIAPSIHQPPMQQQYPVQPTIAAAGATYQAAAAPQLRHPASPTAYQAVQQHAGGIQQVMNNQAVAPQQQHYPVQPQMAVAPVQYQPSPATFGGIAAPPPFNPADYEPMQAQRIASVQPSSAEFVPMFMR